MNGHYSHWQRVLHPERNRILWIITRRWQWCGVFLHAAHLRHVYIYCILLLKIVRSTDTEGRQSNKESAIRRAGNEKGSRFVICKSLFFFFSHYWRRSPSLINPCSFHFTYRLGQSGNFLWAYPLSQVPLWMKWVKPRQVFIPDCFLTADLKEWWRAQSEEQDRGLGTAAMLFLQLWVNS